MASCIPASTNAASAPQASHVSVSFAVSCPHCTHFHSSSVSELRGTSSSLCLCPASLPGSAAVRPTWPSRSPLAKPLPLVPFHVSPPSVPTKCGYIVPLRALRRRDISSRCFFTLDSHCLLAFVVMLCISLGGLVGCVPFACISASISIVCL
jgi:hypothetical protein